MAAASDTTQTIARLTPLADVLALIAREVKPIVPRTLELAAAIGHVLAADAVATARPDKPLALIDGWALCSDLTLGAGGYAPAHLPTMPQRVDAGEPMPPNTDSVAPLDVVNMTEGGAEVLMTVNPGDGVVPAGGDYIPPEPLRRTGEQLRAVDLAVLAAAGLAQVSVREPRVHIAPLRSDTIVTAAARLIAGDLEHQGGAAQLDAGESDLDTVLARESGDCFITVGGTGSGRNDLSVRMLARAGRLAVHGVGLTPGETAAFGFVGTRPVLLLPGRFDAALSVWLVIGRHLLGCLAGANQRIRRGPAEMCTLTRKVVSTVGLAELVPVRRLGDGVEPLMSKYLALSALSRADGWILVPAEREGYSARSSVLVSPWP